MDNGDDKDDMMKKWRDEIEKSMKSQKDQITKQGDENYKAVKQEIRFNEYAKEKNALDVEMANGSVSPTKMQDWINFVRELDASNLKDSIYGYPVIDAENKSNDSEEFKGYSNLRDDQTSSPINDINSWLWSLRTHNSRNEINTQQEHIPNTKYPKYAIVQQEKPLKIAGFPVVSRKRYVLLVINNTTNNEKKHYLTDGEPIENEDLLGMLENANQQNPQEKLQYKIIDSKPPPWPFYYEPMKVGGEDVETECSELIQQDWNGSAMYALYNMLDNINNNNNSDVFSIPLKKLHQDLGEILKNYDSYRNSFFIVRIWKNIYNFFARPENKIITSVEDLKDKFNSVFQDCLAAKTRSDTLSFEYDELEEPTSVGVNYRQFKRRENDKSNEQKLSLSFEDDDLGEPPLVENNKPKEQEPLLLKKSQGKKLSLSFDDDDLGEPPLVENNKPKEQEPPLVENNKPKEPPLVENNKPKEQEPLLLKKSQGKKTSLYKTEKPKLVSGNCKKLKRRKNGSKDMGPKSSIGMIR